MRLGGFHKWLLMAEETERGLTKRMRINTPDAFEIEDEHVLTNRLRKELAINAPVLRSAFKFHIPFEARHAIFGGEENVAEVYHGWPLDKLILPYPRTLIHLENQDKSTYMVLFYSQTVDGEECHVASSVEWHHPENQLVLVPLTFLLDQHFHPKQVLWAGLAAEEADMPRMVEPYGWVVNAVRDLNIALEAGKQETVKGLRPGFDHIRVPAKKHPLFEYEVLTIKVNPAPREEQGARLTTTKHRLHWVRSFRRHYKSGKEVVVKAHERGNAKYGVIKKDYDFKLGDRNG